MSNEKPGGHGERSVAVGVLDMAVWDLVAKIADVPLYKLLADRFNGGSCDPDVAVYAAGGYYGPGKDEAALAEELKGYLDLGYSSVKIKIGGAPLPADQARIEAALDVVGRRRQAGGRRQRPLRSRPGPGLRERPRPLRPALVRGAGRPTRLRPNAAVAGAYPDPLATGENLFSMQDARNLRPLRRDAAGDATCCRWTRR